MNEKNVELNSELIEDMIYVVRGKKVMLDSDLARIYGYETKYLNRQVNNNLEKFPNRYRFRLNEQEIEEISRCKNFTTMMQVKGIKGGRVYLPYVFTEQGIYMLITVLKGEIATKQKMKNSIIAPHQVKIVVME